MKKWFKNLTKGKLAIGVLALCLLVFGGYFGYHKFIVKADSMPNRAVVNTLEDYRKLCTGSENGEVDKTQNIADANSKNAFLILEIVPYYGDAEVGYLIDGCEPIDLTNVGKSVYAAAKESTRSVATAVFKDEYDRDRKDYDDGLYKEDTRWTVDDDWVLTSGKTIKTHGYYEKVANGASGDFVIDHYEQDTTGTFYTKDAEGKDIPAYRPVFRKAKDGETGQFNWTTLYYASADTFVMSRSQFDTYALSENKYVASADEGIDYNPGEREYTTREDSDFYSISYTNDKGEKVASEGNTSNLWVNIEGMQVLKGHVVNTNDFVRTSLDLDDESETACRNLKIAVKTIEPQELKKHPEWIDYADLLYMHQKTSVGTFPDLWCNANLDKYHRNKDVLGESYYKDKDPFIIEADGTVKSKSTDKSIREALLNSNFISDNDWGWTVAKKLFFKINQLETYDGSGKYGFAPLLTSNDMMNDLKGLSGNSRYNADDLKTVTNQHLDYTTMEVGIPKTPWTPGENTGKYTDTGTNCGMYKFLIMNFLMKQENFYNYFFQTERDAGGKVITENGDISYCSPQKSADAQEYWNPDAFLPVAEGNDYTNLTDAQRERYSIYYSQGSYLQFPTPGLAGATFIYNSDTSLSQGFNNARIDETDSTKEAFDWFEKEYGERPDKLTPAQMVHYLLQYKRHGNDDDDVGTRDKETMHVLEIEPCADYFITEKYLVGTYLPASRFKGKIEVDHMTTAEFNGSKRDINGYYDLIYIGDNIGKFNTTTTQNNGVNYTNTAYNDSNLDKYVYLHVGDKSGDVRSSGNDISKLKNEQLQKYAEGGNALVLADSLATFKWDTNDTTKISDSYKNNYLSIVDSTSQMHALLEKLKSANNANKFRKNNICALSKLSVKFLSENCLNYMKNGFSLPAKTKTGLTTKKYKELTTRYKDYVGLYSKITSTPDRYVSDDGMADSNEVNPAKAKQLALTDPQLNFSFIIGDQSSDYAVRMYIDLNGDGNISDDELVQDTFANNSGSPYKFVGEDAKDADGNVFKDKSGNAIQVPAAQNYIYDFSSNKRLYLNKTKTSGAVSWKFVLYNTKTKENYQSVTGTSFYKRSDGKTTSIKALQILEDDQMNSQANLENQLAGSGLFKDWVDKLNDTIGLDENYKVTVKTVSLTDFNSQLQAGTIGGANGEDYNCYIVSCSTKLFGDNTYKDAADYVSSRAKAGASVVVTGETIDDSNKSSEVKDILNMSRFTDDLKLYGDIKDTAKKPKETDKEYDNKNKLEYTYAKVMKEGSGKYKVYNNKLWKDVDYNKVAKAKKISRNNIGSLTTYPYTISSSVDIASSAAQVYQLNMNNEGLVVWYSLGPDGDGDDTEYGISPRDASNNYYLYSVENITYDMIDLANTTSDLEMKLFINTLRGSDVSPAVRVDSAKTVDANYRDFDVSEVTDDYFPKQDSDAIKKSEDGSEMTVFKGVIQPNGSDYRDYKSNSKIVKGDSQSQGSGGKIDDDTTITPAPATPTPKPKREPEILTQKVNSWDDIKSYRSENGSQFKGWDNSSILVIDYKSNAAGNSWYNDGVGYIKDKNGTTVLTLPNKTQVYKITLGQLKEKYGLDKNDDIGYFNIEARDGWCISINLIGIFEDEEQYKDYKNGGSSEDEDTSGTGESIIDKESQKDIFGTHDSYDLLATPAPKYIPDTATHRVSFTPYTNATDCVNVNSFKISMVTASASNLGTSKEKTVSYVDEIYQKVTTATGKYVWKFTANKDHTFTLKEGNFLKDRTQYFFFSDDNYINTTTTYDNDNTRWVRFDISNRRKSAISYLHLYYEGNVDTTYVFDLD